MRVLYPLLQLQFGEVGFVPGKTSEQDENQIQIQPTHGIWPESIWMVEAPECSHHCAIPFPYV